MGGERGAIRWAAGAVLGVSGVLLGVILWRTGGTFVYVLDDPAIHLTVARRLAFDGTWGIVPGEFQAASSSPLWTLLLAPTQWLVPGSAGELVPLVLNLVAAYAVLNLLGPELAVIRRSSPRLGRLAVVVVAVVLLYLPSLSFAGMEHILHLALVLAAVLAVERAWVAPDQSLVRRAGPVWAGLVLLTLATFTRGESAFVAAGLGVAILVVGQGSWRVRLGRAAAIGAAALVALVGVATVNLAFGQDLLPNSVILKALGDRGDTDRSPTAAWDRLWNDPWLGALLVVAVVTILVVGRDPGRAYRAARLFPAVLVVVATVLHVELAATDGSLRYEGYLVGLGVWSLLRVLPDVADWVGRARPSLARYATAATGVVLLIPVAGLQLRSLALVPEDAAGAGGMYEQRYQVARFLDEAYDGEPIAVGELGYVGLYHDGPLTDVYGLGDHEVLEARMADRHDEAFWRDLQQQRGFRVAVVYPFALRGQVPEDWISVAIWRSPEATFEVTQFWATVPQEVDPLLASLREYESELPDEVEVGYNELASLAAYRRMQEAAAAGSTGER